jgi:hypothetical protein
VAATDTGLNGTPGIQGKLNQQLHHNWRERTVHPKVAEDLGRYALDAGTRTKFRSRLYAVNTHDGRHEPSG